MGATLDYIADSLGGRDFFLDACRQCDNSRVQDFLLLQAANPSESLQDLATRSGLTIPDLLSTVLATVIIQQNNVSLWLSALSRPTVMQASIASSMIPGAEGFADRQLQLKIGGLAPKEGGIQIFNQVNTGVRAAGLPSFEDRARISAEAVRGQLPSPSADLVAPKLEDELEVPDVQY